MAPQKRKRQQVVDSPLDEIRSKKPKLSSTYSRLSKRREARADNHLHAQISSEDPTPSVLPKPLRSGKRKTQAEDHLRDQIPNKKPKSTETDCRPSNFPPEFYDSLSKIWLTRRALRELDRRNEHLPPPKPKPRPWESRAAKLAALARLGVPDLAVFATAGGPDLSDLQGVCLLSIFTIIS
jgi:hypothetical protein